MQEESPKSCHFKVFAPQALSLQQLLNATAKAGFCGTAQSSCSAWEAGHRPTDQHTAPQPRRPVRRQSEGGRESSISPAAASSQRSAKATLRGSFPSPMTLILKLNFNVNFEARQILWTVGKARGNSTFETMAKCYTCRSLNFCKIHSAHFRELSSK